MRHDDVNEKLANHELPSEVQRAPFWADARMLGEVIRVLTASADLGRSHCPSTLFPQGKSRSAPALARRNLLGDDRGGGSSCINSRAGSGFPMAADQSLNLLSGELVEV